MSRTKDKSLEPVFIQAGLELGRINNHRTVLKLLAIQGYAHMMGKEIARLFNTEQRTLLKWVEQFKRDGISGLKDKKKGHRRALIRAEHQEAISRWIETCKTPRGEDVRWTLGLLCCNIKQEYDIDIKKSAMANTLKKMGIVLKRPRPVHAQSSPEKQAEFKKNFRNVAPP